ncbi:recombinase family protein [Tsukamurella spumae]|uniref:Recombinase family protein n=2 Tax=Tsukamurella spumae TaxID=44753 RepID=A0A846X3Q5_9ACTN|nr:recombinase family protein [Tsukamurella spumae]
MVTVEGARAVEGRVLGYARVSTVEQDEGLQLDALDRAGCSAVWTDHGVSGSTTSRPRLDALLAELSGGDTLVVYSLSRLGRNLSHLVVLTAELAERDIALVSITEQIDTSSASGRMVMHIFLVLAEFERALLSERTRAGLAAARARGARPGRRPSLSVEQVRHARLLVAGGESVGHVAGSMGVHRATLYRALGAATAE